MAKHKTKKWPIGTVYKYGTGYGFFPDTILDVERVSQDCSVNQQYTIEPKQPRNYERLKLWWARMNVVYNNDRYGYATPEKISKAILIQMGRCSPLMNLETGEIIMEADSIAFANMPESEFKKVLNLATEIIWQHWGISEDDLKKEAAKLTQRVIPFNKVQKDKNGIPYQQEKENVRVKTAVTAGADYGEEKDSEDQAAA